MAALLLCAGCTALSRLRDSLGFISTANAPPARTTPTPRGPSPFAPYLLKAFPGLDTVRLDPRSPRLSLAAESVLTHEDPHLHRGPPRFSPDGRLIAWEERLGDVRRLLIRRVDGEAIREITLTPEKREARYGDVVLSTPMTWAPSSDALAWTQETPLGAFEVVMADLAGTPVHIAGPPAVDGAIEWSPLAERILYVPATHDDELWTIDTTTRKATFFARAPGRIQSFSWSGDGRRIVLSAGAEQRDIFLMDAKAGASAKALTRWNFDDLSPSFSPDGNWIAFYTSYRAQGRPGFSLAVIAGDGTDPPAGAVLMDRVRESLVEVHDGTPPPAWAPDSRWVAVVEPQTDEYHQIALIEVARSFRHEITPESVTNEDVTVSCDGVLAYRARNEWGDHIVLGLAARGATRTER